MPKKKQLKTIMSLTNDLNNDNLTVEDIDSLYEAEPIAFNKTKEGLEYLRNAKRLEETDIDRKSLREYKGTN